MGPFTGQVVKEEQELDRERSNRATGSALPPGDVGPDIDEIDARLHKLQQFLQAAKAGKAAR